MKYIIIGGVAGGMSAAMEIYRTDETAEITVLEQGEIYSYGQCGLPYTVGGLVSSPRDLIVRSVDTFREKYGIDAKVNTKVTSIDSDSRLVSGQHVHTSEPFELSYDRLLIATGSSPAAPDFPGKQLPGIHTLKTIPDTERIIEDLTDDIQNVIIVGDGYIGLEMAENFSAIGKQVTIIQRGPQLAKIFDKDMAELIHKQAREKGIKLVLNEEVKSFKGADRVRAVETDEATYDADLVLLSIGIKPNTEFLTDSGVHLTNKGAIYVNPRQQTNVENIYAAGDCATNHHRIKQIDDHIPLGTTANKQGRIAGANMAGGDLTFKGIVGTSLLKFFDLTLGRTGITEREATALNIPYKIQTTKAGSGAGYFPNIGTMEIKLLYHAKTYELLGGQIIGDAGVDKKVDVLATALYAKLTIHDLVDLDLGYAPPYNGVWDPLQAMARRTFD